MSPGLRLVLLTALATGLAGGIAYGQDPQRFTGVTAHYQKNYKGRTASGEAYDGNKFTAAHRTLPFGTRLLVTDPKSGRSVEVVINDRGPFTKGRMLDLSLAAAKEIGMIGRGLLKVTAEVK